MNTFRLVISSPDGNLFDNEIINLSVRGVDGDLAVMAGHIPLITSLKPGECRIVLEDGSEKSGYINGGLLSVSTKATTLLSGSFHW